MLSEARQKQIDHINKLHEPTEVVDDSDPITDVVVDNVVETVLEGHVDTQQRKFPINHSDVLTKGTGIKFVNVQKNSETKSYPTSTKRTLC